MMINVNLGEGPMIEGNNGGFESNWSSGFCALSVNTGDTDALRSTAAEVLLGVLGTLGISWHGGNQAN